MSKEGQTAPLILIVEDNQDDLFLIERALLRAGVSNERHVAHSGQEAISYLSGDPPYADRRRYPLPAVVLLDIHMPGTDGFVFLEYLQHLVDRPLVIMMTASCSPEELARAYALGANDHVEKSGTFGNLVAHLKTLEALA
jgi:CheY-like chemotaxis protein